jgi:hypothetical protein
MTGFISSKKQQGPLVFQARVTEAAYPFQRKTAKLAKIEEATDLFTWRSKESA